MPLSPASYYPVSEYSSRNFLCIYTNTHTYICVYICVYVYYPHMHAYIIIYAYYTDVSYLFIYLFIWLHWVFVAARGLLSCGMQTLSCGMHVGSSSLTRDQTWAPCIGSMESYPLHHQGSPYRCLLIFYFLINLFIFYFIFWLCWVFVAVRGLSLVAASGGYSLLQCAGFSL